MRLYQQPHAFYAGVDLHARSLFTHVLDRHGRTVFERDLPACPDSFLHAWSRRGRWQLSPPRAPRRPRRRRCSR
jgi:hypothetical protein